jgi:ATP phosphoribosyltransferase regulatory subunit HisZ
MDGADAAPTADAETAAEKWEAAGADALARWKLVEGDVVTVNAALQKAKLQPLK